MSRLIWGNLSNNNKYIWSSIEGYTIIIVVAWISRPSPCSPPEMKYQKRLRDEVERVLPERKGQFICYKGLKKQLKLINPRSSRDRRMGDDRSGFATGRCLDVNNNIRERIGFSWLLHSELNNVNAFYFDKEEDYVIRLKVFNYLASFLCDKKELLFRFSFANMHG